MDIEEVAQDLIHAVHGDMTEQNIAGVIKVFKSIQEMVDFKWEKHLAEETTENLAIDRIKCSNCKNPIQIVRTRKTIYYRS